VTTRDCASMTQRARTTSRDDDATCCVFLATKNPNQSSSEKSILALAQREKIKSCCCLALSQSLALANQISLAQCLSWVASQVVW